MHIPCDSIISLLRICLTDIITQLFKDTHIYANPLIVITALFRKAKSNNLDILEINVH